MLKFGGGGILSQRQVCFFKISIKFLIFHTLYDLFQEKKINLIEGHFSSFRHKNKTKIEMPQNKEKYLF
jgi:hypothetical protein